MTTEKKRVDERHALSLPTPVNINKERLLCLSISVKPTQEMSDYIACPPPQDARVLLTHSTRSEAGRYAVSRDGLSPGELALVAAPFVLVMNPTHVSSGLYLAAHAEVNTESAKSKQKSSKKAADATTPSWDTTSTGAIWRTTDTAFCSGCFQTIEAGRWLCNRTALRELSMDLTAEQEALTAAMCKAGEAEVGSPDGNEEDATLSNSSATKKLKKPSRSAKLRKDSAVQLRQRLIEKTVDEKKRRLEERQEQRRQRLAVGLPALIEEGWEAPAFFPSAEAVNAYGTPVAGCSGCGVPCYCSKQCWLENNARHRETGECAMYRVLYSHMMSIYYSVVPQRGAGALTSVWMPGEEPLHWASTGSEAKSLEVQSLLVTAMTMARMLRSGYADHWGCDSAAEGRLCSESKESLAEESSTPGASLSPSPPPPPPSEAAAPSGDSEVTVSSPLSEHRFASAAAAMFSVEPREAQMMQEKRHAAGLTGTVEVLDNSPELKRIANEVPNLSCYTVDAIFKDGAGGSPSSNSSLDTKQHVRHPRYADVAQLVTNLCVISKDRRALYKRYYRAFMKHVMPVLRITFSSPQWQTSCKQRDDKVNLDNCVANDACGVAGPIMDISESFFIRLCAAAQCNSFGVYEKNNVCIGFGFYPEASYFNHSCAPNLCRVMHKGGASAAFYALREIAAGEPLTICYTDIEERSSAERRRNLLSTYRFFCLCERCHGASPAGPASSAPSTSAAPSSAAMVDTGARRPPIELCMQCQVRGYLRPLPPLLYGTTSPHHRWRLSDIQQKECTTCQRRVEAPCGVAAKAERV